MAPRPPRTSLFHSRMIIGLIAAGIALLLFGLLAVSYTLFAAAAFGVVLGIAVIAALRILTRRQRLLFLAVAGGAVVLVLAMSLRSGPRSYPMALVASVPAYSVTIRPGPDAGTFVVSEEADVEVESFTSPAPQATRVKASQTVAAASKGLFLQEVTFAPLAKLAVALPDGEEVPPALVTDMDSRLTVKLQDLPKGSFYAARHALNLAAHPYLDTETLTWSPTDLSDAISFAYVPSPANQLRPLLGPFLTASSLSQWAVGLIVALAAALFGTFVQPALMGRLKGTLNPWLPEWMKEKAVAATANTTAGNTTAGNTTAGNTTAGDAAAANTTAGDAAARDQ
jgi:hypothetical protein